MAVASASALKLAGFLLTHALWVVSDLPEGEVYVPQALCKKDGARRLIVFEADTQAEAIEHGKQFLAEDAVGFDRCAFARDGRARGVEGYVDLITLDVVEGGGPSALTVIQPYRTLGGFALLGDEILATADGTLAESDEQALRATLRSGSTAHPAAADTWNIWNSSRAERPSPFH